MQMVSNMSANEAEVGREEFSAETEDLPAELGDGPDVIVEPIIEDSYFEHSFNSRVLCFMVIKPWEETKIFLQRCFLSTEIKEKRYFCHI